MGEPLADREPPRLPASVFLNYARADREIAEWLRDRLRDAGVSVWMDTSAIRGGARWKEEIDRALWQRQFVVAVLTRNSVAPEREWVHYEQERALRLLKPPIPCLFEEAESFLGEGLLPERLHPFNVIPFEPDRDTGLRELVDSIRSRLRRFGKELRNEAAGIRHAFVGREEDLRRIHELVTTKLLQPTGRKVVGIVGMGGLGKTMLAEELVRRLAYDYPGGVLIESRAGEAQSAAEVMRRWVEYALEQPPERAYTDSEVRALLATFGEMLVLLDDVSEDDFFETKALLKALPLDATRILTTRRLDVSDGLGAVSYTLEPFSPSDAMALAESRLRDRMGERLISEGIVFEEEFQKYEGSIAELVHIVEGHPLALDLGIGTCDYLAEIPIAVKRLSSSLKRGVQGFERGLALDSADRNASLAMSLDQSLKDLERHDRAAGTDWVGRYRALGVLPDGSRAPRELLYALWDDSGAETEEGDAALKGLCRRAMLRVDHRGLYYNHPVVRAFAVGLLDREGGQALAVRTRYRRWVVDRATWAYGQPQEQWKEHHLLIEHVQQVRREVTAEIERRAGPLGGLALPEPPASDARASLATVDPVLLTLGADLARAVEERVIRRPQWGEEGLMCLRLGLACARGFGSLDQEVTFLQRLGRVLAKNDPKIARRYFSAGLELARQIGDERQVAGILTYYGELERTQGRWNAAIDLLGQGLKLHRRWGDPPMEADTLISIGEVYWRKSDFETALNHYRLALEIHEAHDNVGGVANCLNKIGSVEFNRGRHREAIEKFQQALGLHEQLGDQVMEAEDKNDLGAAYRYLGDNLIALGLFAEACEIDVRIGNRRHESYARGNMAGAMMALGRFSDALQEAVVARQIAEEVEDPIPLMWVSAILGASLQGLDRYEEAETSLRAALEICRGIEAPRDLAGILGMLASLLAEKPAGRAEARELLVEAISVMETHRLEQAFGGRRTSEFHAALAALEL